MTERTRGIVPYCKDERHIRTMRFFATFVVSCTLTACGSRVREVGTLTVLPWRGAYIHILRKVFINMYLYSFLFMSQFGSDPRKPKK